MSDLVFIAFPSEQKAEEVREKVLEMQKEYLIELGDAVVAVKDDKGRIKLNQLMNTTAAGAASAWRRPGSSSHGIQRNFWRARFHPRRTGGIFKKLLRFNLTPRRKLPRKGVQERPATSARRDRAPSP